jgi:hypothetical protein
MNKATTTVSSTLYWIAATIYSTYLRTRESSSSTLSLKIMEYGMEMHIIGGSAYLKPSIERLKRPLKESRGRKWHRWACPL